MEKYELIDIILKSDIFKKWHWYSFHFQFYALGCEHPFAGSLVDAILDIDNKINGYAISVVHKIASISGREKYRPHYEQLLQICSEIYVISQAARYFSDSSYVFRYEPTSISLKNPKIIIESPAFRLGLEVKQPSLLDHMEKRSHNMLQLPHRLDIKPEDIDAGITLPRDNCVKDFLISSDDKFKGFKELDSNFTSILFIVWDDYIFEPISALLGEPSGLLQDTSFAVDPLGNRLTFCNVDAIILDRQMIQFILATRTEPLLYGKSHAMEYGTVDKFPYKVIIPNPVGKPIINDIRNCFQVRDINDIELGAEYIPSDGITWFRSRTKSE